VIYWPPRDASAIAPPVGLTNTATLSTNRASAAAPFSVSTAEALAPKFVSFAEPMMPSSWVSLAMGDLLILDF
jgi:hypothetical protein